MNQNPVKRFPPSGSILAETHCDCKEFLIESECLQYEKEVITVHDRGRTRILQRTVTRRTRRRLSWQEAPIQEGTASPVGRPPYADGILPDKVRAIREIQGRLPHERRNAVSGPAKGNPAPHRRPVTPWWMLGDDL